METLIMQIASAVNTRALYPANHPRVVQAVELIVATLHEILKERKSDSVTFLVVGDDLVAEQQVLRKGSLSQRQLTQMLARARVERLTLAHGLDSAEVHPFVSALATGEEPQSTAHIILGRVHVAIDADSTTTTEEDRKVWADQLEIVRSAFAKFRMDKTLPLAPMDQLVWGFIDSLSQSTHQMLPLAKLKEHDEYTFVHSVNVSLLVLAQARSFGIEGSMLHAFGLAGLLHDIGKMMVPLSVLNHPGKLEGEQWAQMQSHAEQGAWYLAQMEGAIPLTIAVAYEHHFRVDGKPNYPISKTPRLPNLASRMTSIADTYDAMSTIRPYQQPLMRATALEVLQKRAGTFYDPVLVPNFLRLVNEMNANPSS
jgi:HD-GYP domain-containing protein (c-di-GMP phosphodiesterase class II)